VPIRQYQYSKNVHGGRSYLQCELKSALNRSDSGDLATGMPVLARDKKGMPHRVARSKKA
jgi:hypothetical protein